MVTTRRGLSIKEVAQKLTASELVGLATNAGHAA
jgi:hypothetical protein